MATTVKVEDLNLKEETKSILCPWISSVKELAALTSEQVLAIPDLDWNHLREIRRCLRNIGLELQSNGRQNTALIQFKKKGRPKGSKDKTPGSEARKKACKANPWKNGNGSRRTDNDRFRVDTLDISKDEVKRYGKLWRAALRGEHADLEEDIANTMGMNYALYKMIGERILGRGYVDIPIYVLDSKGEIMRDDDGNQVLKSIRTPRGEIEIFIQMQKSLGIDAGDQNLTARSQGRQRRDSNQGALEEIKLAKFELDANRKLFSKKVG